jgi:hypothetical protein
MIFYVKISIKSVNNFLKSLISNIGSLVCFIQSDLDKNLYEMYFKTLIFFIS